jgi:hypothetical protein
MIFKRAKKSVSFRLVETNTISLDSDSKNSYLLRNLKSILSKVGTFERIFVAYNRPKIKTIE